MKRSSSLNNGFSIIIGAFLILEGLWGLTDDVVFGILSTNQLHATIHLVLGVIAMTLGFRQNARNFTLFLGLLLLVVGTLRFVPGADSVLISFLNVNENVAFLNIFIGAAALAVAAPKPLVVEETQETIAEGKPRKSNRLSRMNASPIQKPKKTANAIAADTKVIKHPAQKEKLPEAKLADKKVSPAPKKESAPEKTKKINPPNQKVMTSTKDAPSATEKSQVKKSVAKKNNRRKTKPFTGEKS